MFDFKGTAVFMYNAATYILYNFYFRWLWGSTKCNEHCKQKFC